MKKKYVIQDREAGNVIEVNIPTEEMAKRILKHYEKTDKKEGNYTPNFYEIKEMKHKTYNVQMTFEHTYFMTIYAKNKDEAKKLAAEIEMDSGDERVLDEGDGMFGKLISIDEVKENDDFITY